MDLRLRLEDALFFFYLSSSFEKNILFFFFRLREKSFFLSLSFFKQETTNVSILKRDIITRSFFSFYRRLIGKSCVVYTVLSLLNKWFRQTWQTNLECNTSDFRFWDIYTGMYYWRICIHNVHFGNRKRKPSIECIWQNDLIHQTRIMYYNFAKRFLLCIYYTN